MSNQIFQILNNPAFLTTLGYRVEKTILAHLSRQDLHFVSNVASHIKSLNSLIPKILSTNSSVTFALTNKSHPQIDTPFSLLDPSALSPSTSQPISSPELTVRPSEHASLQPPSLPLDTVYLSYHRVKTNASQELYTHHARSRSWWRGYLRDPYLVGEQITPDQCLVEFHRKQPSEGQDLSVVERTDIVDVSGHRGRVIRNVRSLNSAIAVFLQDSYHEVDGYPFLKIHPWFVPVRTALVASGEGVGGVVDKIRLDLRRHGLEYEFYESTGEEGEDTAITRKCDLEGVLYTVLIGEETRTDGVVRIRDRDTHFCEPVNVKNLVKHLKLNMRLFECH